MKVKQINWIDKESKEAEVLLSNGIYDLICFAHPFLNSIGEKLTSILVSFEDKIFVSQKKNFLIEKNGSDNFSYFIRGKVIDAKNNIVEIGDIKIELTELPSDLDNNDFVEGVIERIDLY